MTNQNIQLQKYLNNLINKIQKKHHLYRFIPHMQKEIKVQVLNSENQQQIKQNPEHFTDSFQLFDRYFQVIKERARKTKIEEQNYQKVMEMKNIQENQRRLQNERVLNERNQLLQKLQEIELKKSSMNVVLKFFNRVLKLILSTAFQFKALIGISLLLFLILIGINYIPSDLQKVHQPLKQRICLSDEQEINCLKIDRSYSRLYVNPAIKPVIKQASQIVYSIQLQQKLLSYKNENPNFHDIYYKNKNIKTSFPDMTISQNQYI